MEAKDVRRLPWKVVTNWSGLSASLETNWIRGTLYDVCSKDVEAFVENVFRDVARKLNIPYEELRPILKAENEAFYLLKEHMYKDHEGYGRRNEKLIKLQNMLRVPDTSNIEAAVTADNVSACLKMFEGLSDIEKMAFLQKIGKLNVKIEYLAVEPEETTVE